MPVLGDGEFYFATDKTRLFVGLGGGAFEVGVMSVQIQDSAGNNLTSTAGALDVNLKSESGSVPITGSVIVSNFPATQPVSGTVAVSNLPATQPVSGTVAISNFPATQPVSGSIAISNFPATQPVSGSISIINFPASQPTTQVGGTSGLVGDTQIKAVQGTVALMVQDFKDAGRVIRTFTASFTAAATEALVSLTPATDGTAAAAGTSFTVTAGKRFRVQALFLTCFNTTAAIHACQVNLRMSASGAVTATSTLIGTVGVTTAAATIGDAASQAQSFPDGLELSGTMQFGISQIGIALAGQTVVLVGYEY